MNYTKPQIVVLGDASSLIEGCGKGVCPGDGGVDQTISGAYDLDE